MYKLTLTMLFMSLFMLAGCAASQPQSTGSESSELSNTQRYQRAVNRSAALKNLDVHWVNPPDEDDLDEYDEEDS